MFPMSLAYSKGDLEDLAIAWRFSQFMHCYRELNKVADILSNMGGSHPKQHLRL